MNSPDTALVPTVAQPLALPLDTQQRVRQLVEDGTPANTRRAYQGDVAYFAAWFQAAFPGARFAFPVPVPAVLAFVQHHVDGLPAAVEQQLVDCGAKKPGPHRLATVRRRVASLSVAHQLQHQANPCEQPEVRMLLSRAARALTERAARGEGGPVSSPKAAATLDVLERMLATCATDSLQDTRDRAMLLFAFGSGGRRRSEVAAARVEDVQLVGSRRAPAYRFMLRRSKTDQEGEGVALPVLGRAAVALQDWLQLSGLAAGPLFRAVNRHGQLSARALDGSSVARIVQHRAALAGLDWRKFGGHSLRAGFVTEGGRQGVALPELMQLTGHKSVRVAARYHREGDVLNSRAARLAG